MVRICIQDRLCNRVCLYSICVHVYTCTCMGCRHCSYVCCHSTCTCMGCRHCSYVCCKVNGGRQRRGRSRNGPDRDQGEEDTVLARNCNRPWPQNPCTRPTPPFWDHQHCEHFSSLNIFSFLTYQWSNLSHYITWCIRISSSLTDWLLILIGHSHIWYHSRHYHQRCHSRHHRHRWCHSRPATTTRDTIAAPPPPPEVPQSQPPSQVMPQPPRHHHQRYHSRPATTTRDTTVATNVTGDATATTTRDTTTPAYQCEKLNRKSLAVLRIASSPMQNINSYWQYCAGFFTNAKSHWQYYAKPVY